jgi:transcriptional regulator with XRE-family HTH domain
MNDKYQFQQQKDEIRQRFYVVLQKLKITNKTFAQEIGVSPSEITEYLKGRTNDLPCNWILALNNIYSVEIDWLLSGVSGVNVTFSHQEKHNEKTLKSDIEYLAMLYGCTKEL